MFEQRDWWGWGPHGDRLLGTAEDLWWAPARQLARNKLLRLSGLKTSCPFLVEDHAYAKEGRWLCQWHGEVTTKYPWGKSQWVQRSKRHNPRKDAHALGGWWVFYFLITEVYAAWILKEIGRKTWSYVHLGGIKWREEHYWRQIICVASDGLQGWAEAIGSRVMAV